MALGRLTHKHPELAATLLFTDDVWKSAYILAEKPIPKTSPTLRDVNRLFLNATQMAGCCLDPLQFRAGRELDVKKQPMGEGAEVTPMVLARGLSWSAPDNDGQALIHPLEEDIFQ